MIQAISSMGFTSPTEPQQHMIRPIVKGTRHVILQEKAGSGKTLLFLIGGINKVIP